MNGNPGGKLVEDQADLAIETLRQEWAELKPTLVVCVAEGYCERLVYDAFGVQQNENDGFETVAALNGTFWRRKATNNEPAFLWMKHPQGKTRGYLEDAETIAREMILDADGTFDS